MALDLKINLNSCDCSNLSFNELTSSYTTSNPTGWGTPNNSTVQAISAVLQITTPSGSNFTFNVLLSGFPTSNTNLTYNIPYGSLGLISLIDGIYTATYTVITKVGDADPVTWTVTNSFLITCNLECCVASMLSNIDDLQCDCNKDKKDNYLTALALLYSINKDKICGDITTANNNFTLANKLCKNLNCITCKDNHK